MPTNTTTMALSSPSNPNPLTVSAASQSSSASVTCKDDLNSVSPQLIQHHELATSCEPSVSSDEGASKHLSSPITNVNGLSIGCSITNGIHSDIVNVDHDSPNLNQQQQQQHSPPLAAGLCDIDSIDLNNISKNQITIGSSNDIVDMTCLTSSSSPTSSTNLNNNQFLNGSTNGGHLMAQAQQSSTSMNFQASNSPDSSPWSIGGDVDNSGFVNYSFANNGLHNKRPIMSQQPHHGLSPNGGIGNSSIGGNSLPQQQQQFIHLNKNGNNNSFSSHWSNTWQSHQQHQQMEQQILQQQQSSQLQTNWNNRGRSSVPNMNPLSPHLPPQSHHQRKHQPPLTQYSMPPSAFSSCSQGLLSPNSPSKYRRSTSYPGKQQQHSMHGGGYQMDAIGGGIIEDQSSYMSPYQDRNLDMRSLDHCLNDITTTPAMQSDLKGFLNCNSTTLQSLAQLQGKLDFHEFIPGKPFFQCGDDQVDDGVGFLDGNSLQIGSPNRSSPNSQGSDNGERFSRKVFVGGLPPDIDEDEITSSFRRFGPLIVDWPHKAESKSYFPPKGYAFLLFQDESSVQSLIDSCIVEEEKLYICVSSPTIKNKPVQIRPWRLSDADYVFDASMSLDPRKTVFVGGVPRPLKALELAMIMNRLYGYVCYAGIDTDPELKYPKGAGRVAFSSQQSYIAAISARFVQLQHGDIDKRVEVKPYVLDDQMCDECGGQRCNGKFAPFFCANVICLQYYCEHCWATIHSSPGREYHKPLVKEGADRPRAVPFRWC